MGALVLVEDWDREDSGAEASEEEMASEVLAEVEITRMVPTEEDISKTSTAVQIGMKTVKDKEMAKDSKIDWVFSQKTFWIDWMIDLRKDKVWHGMKWKHKLEVGEETGLTRDRKLIRISGELIRIN